MSVVSRIIKLLTRKKNTMDEMINEFATPESNHPVLQGMRDKISALETSLVKATEIEVERVQTINRMRQDKWSYEERVKTVLTEALEDYDDDTVRHIAEQLDIALTVTKTYEVNVTFTVEVEHEIGAEPDPEWDFEFTVAGDTVQDFTSDVIFSTEV